MEQKNTFNLVRNNRVALGAYFAVAAIMLIFCILQAVGGRVSVAYLLAAAFLALVPVIGAALFFKKNQASNAVRHFVAIGFAIFYTFILFTTTDQLVFVFAVPMMMIYSVYGDTRGSLMVSGGVMLENIIVAILGAYTGGFGYQGAESAILQVTVMLLVGIYSILTANTLQKNFANVLAELTQVSDEMRSGIADIHTGIEKLSAASNTTVAAMREVSTGTGDTAEAVQSQLLQTQEIQDKAVLLSAAADDISNHMKETIDALEQGGKNVSQLVDLAQQSAQNGGDVENRLQKLEDYVQEMDGIVESISTIARQTSLLALNARIEAARAGEAGKGFAVVAEEISQLAQQSQSAASGISGRIESVTDGIEDVVEVIHQMLGGIGNEQEATVSTADSFEAIQTATRCVRDNLDLLIAHIRELEMANERIMDSVQTISAVSEEVSAHAVETMNAEGRSVDVLRGIEERMQELNAVIGE